MLNVEKKTSSQSFAAEDARKMFLQSFKAILSNPGKVASGFSGEADCGATNVTSGNWRDFLAQPVSFASCQVASGYGGDRSKPIDRTDAHPQLLNVPDPVDMFLTSHGNSPISDKNRTLVIPDLCRKLFLMKMRTLFKLAKMPNCQ